MLQNFLEDVSLGRLSLKKGMITEGNYSRRYRGSNKGNMKSNLTKPTKKARAKFSHLLF